MSVSASVRRSGTAVLLLEACNVATSLERVARHMLLHLHEHGV